MKSIRVYKQIENRLKVLGLSYTALKILIGPVVVAMFTFILGAINGSVSTIVISLVLAGGSYALILLLDSSRFIQSIFDQKLPTHLINDPLENDTIK